MEGIKKFCTWSSLKESITFIGITKKVNAFMSLIAKERIERIQWNVKWKEGGSRLSFGLLSCW